MEKWRSGEGLKAIKPNSFPDGQLLGLFFLLLTQQMTRGIN